MVFGMPRALFPEIAHEAFGGPDRGGLAFALLFAAIPAGAVLGGIFSGWVSRVDLQGRAVIVCILVWGVAMTGFGLAVGLADGGPGPMLVVAVLMLVVVGAGGPRIADVVHGASAAMVGTAAAAAGGGVLVVVGTTVAALAAPAFVR